MPSVKNPNGPSKNRLAARTATARKHSSKRLARQVRVEKHQITGADARRGARAGLLPTSGPNKALGAKAARKLERKMKYALQRKMAAEGEVEMKDVADGSDTQAEKQKEGAIEGDAAIEMDDIS
ncbi:hypothetical protein F4802DRAFT_269863 [Xylaria palmicola]|nr:hypothetical protein F4802DRAFT_269863 [Xylaria palmicola]